MAARRGSRLSVRLAARERAADVRRRPRRPARETDAALWRVRAEAVAGGGGSFTPARRALERPMAIACFAERAPCLPSRTCRISSCTYSPACVVGALPCRFALRARSRVFCSGITSTPRDGAVSWPTYASSAPRAYPTSRSAQLRRRTSARYAGAMTGSSRMNVVPSPSVDSTRMSPLSASTQSATIDSPNPRPLFPSSLSRSACPR